MRSNLLTSTSSTHCSELSWMSGDLNRGLLSPSPLLNSLHHTRYPIVSPGHRIFIYFCTTIPPKAAGITSGLNSGVFGSPDPKKQSPHKCLI